MTLPTLTPVEARRLVEQGAVMVDIREADEHARERIPGARHIALSKLDEADFAAHSGQTVILHCRSGARTLQSSKRLAEKTGQTCQAFIVAGGLEAWRKAGLPTIVDRRQPIELLRQAQIAAGALSFVGTLLALTISNWFLVIPFGVGAGLVFAGLTGCCGMARLLQRAPWNQTSQAAQ
jgi:rhodanese-related sulfurtransferase